MQFGLIGKSLSHSFSISHFTEKFEREETRACYRNFELKDISEFPYLLMKEPNLIGLNVTIPYKEAIIPYLDSISPAAESIGAVNTIHLSKGKLVGFNTDVVGFRKSLAPHIPEIKSALILGTGGASKAIQWVLKSLQIPFELVSRSGANGTVLYEALSAERLKEKDLIINTTPLGTFPNIEEMPNLPYAGVREGQLAYDLVYNPETTAFLSAFAGRGARIKNGLEMLQLQAEAAWEIWNN